MAASPLYLLLGPGLGLLAALVLVLGARRGWPRALSWALVVAPTAASAFFATRFNQVGWHGLFHYSHTVQVLRHLPPEDPLLAGRPLLYPVAYDWLFGHLFRALDLPLVPGLAVFDVGLAVATLFLLDAVARRFGGGRLGRDVTVALGYWGVAWGLAWAVGFLAAPWLGVTLDNRPFPLDKFANPNANQVGYLAFVAFFLSSLALVRGEPHPWRWRAALAASTLAAAFLYPLAWGLSGVGLALGGLLAVVATRTRAVLVRVLDAGATAALASLPALPFLAAFSGGKSAKGSFHLATTLAEVGTRLPTLVLFALVALAVLAWRWQALRQKWRGEPVSMAWALAPAAGFLGAYLLVRGPGWGEYKLLLQACLPLAVLLGVAVDEMAQAPARRLAWVVLAVALPAAGAIQTIAYRFTIEPCVEIATQGFTMISPVPEEEAIYAFLRARTPPDAVVLTSDSSTPALGQRSLYVGYDVQRRNQFNGWGVPLTTLLEVTAGHPADVVRTRRQVGAWLISRESTVPPPEALARVRQDIGARPFYVLHADPVVVARLVESGAFRVAQASPWATLLEATR